MQLKIQRSQRTGGIVGKTVFFCLDVRADYSAEERSNIQKYKLGSQGIYNSRAAQKHFDNMDTQLARVDSKSAKEQLTGLARGVVSLALAKMSLNITIASLGKGHHVECKDLQELLEAEDTVRTACKDVTRFLEVADTFNGSETVIEYERGEERVHVMQSALPLLTDGTGTGETFAASEPQTAQASPMRPFEIRGDSTDAVPNALEVLGRYWNRLETRIIALAEDRGLTINRLHVRIAAVVISVLTISILVQIL